jgi:hypothetical protein
MQKLNRTETDVDLARSLGKVSPELLKAIASAPLHPQAQQKIRKRRQPKTQDSSIVDRIQQEIRGCETEQDVRPFRDLILKPLPDLSWTENLPGYEDARLSAENAMRRIFASTAAARAGFEAGHPESVLLEVFFHKVRVGLIQADSPEILQILQHAQQVGGTVAYLFIERLYAELNNARKRVFGAPQFPQFRVLLVCCWVRDLFWLMSDDLVARVVTTRRMKPDGCNRQTITKAVKELGLVKHQDTARRPIVKGLGRDGFLIFREGYPPKG